MCLIKSAASQLLSLCKWSLFALSVGAAGGMIGAGFMYAFRSAVGSFAAYRRLLFFLPIAGMLIAALYRMTGQGHDGGTNDVILSIREGKPISAWMMPLIMLSTCFTHLCGGSAGKEGAALQIGGSLGNTVGNLFRLDDDGRKLLSLCGMAAVFSAVFGTPVTASLFVLEFISIGVVFSSAFPAVLISSMTALETAGFLGIRESPYPAPPLPDIGLPAFGKTAVLALIAGLVSILFCILLHTASTYFSVIFKNCYLRAFFGGVLVILLTLLSGSRLYNGSGHPIIETVLAGHAVVPWFFLVKMVFTSISIGAGFKGGEIVPTLTVGATLGAALAPFLSLDPVFGAAVGMIALFAGVTNSVIASAVLGGELFGFNGILFFALAASVSYAVSGNYSLYRTQQLLFPKASGRILSHFSD